MNRRIIFSTIVLSAAIILGLLAASCAGPEPAPPPAEPAPPPVEPATPVIDAGAIYSTTCVPCHGANREGITGLGKPLTPESLASRSDTEIRGIITNGKPNTAMQSFKGTLTTGEINALAQFIKNIEP